MSYDIRLDGGRPPQCVWDGGNMTCNVSSMWTLALDGMRLSQLDGCMAGNFIERLERAVAHMQAPENYDMYQAMNPSNGWGDHEGATAYLANLLEGCKQHPEATIYISY